MASDEQTIADLRAEIAVHKATITKLGQKNKKMLYSITELTEAKKKAIEDRDQLVEKYAADRATGKNERLIESISKLEKDLQSKSQSIVAIKRTNKELKERNQTIAANVKELKELIGAQEKKLLNQSGHIGRLLKAKKKLCTKINQIESAEELISTQNKSAEELISKEKKLSVQSGIIDQLTKSNKELCAKIDALENEPAYVSAQRELVENTAKGKVIQIDGELFTQITDEEVQKTSIYKDISKQNDLFHQIIDSLDMQIEKLTAANDSKDQIRNADQKTIKALEDLVETKTQLIKEIRETILMKNIESKILINESDHLKQKNIDLTQIIAEQKEQMRSASGQKVHRPTESR